MTLANWRLGYIDMCKDEYRHNAWDIFNCLHTSLYTSELLIQLVYSLWQGACLWCHGWYHEVLAFSTYIQPKKMFLRLRKVKCRELKETHT